MLTVYGRKTRLKTVIIYRDKECKNIFVIFNNLQINKPDYRNKYVTLNCYRWKLEWLPSW